MGLTRQIRNSFRGGVLSPNLKGLTGSELYNQGLQVGQNITVQTVGGITRRAGTLFIRDYGSLKYMRLFPFQFNRDQKYLIAIRLGNDNVTVMDIYRDNVLVAPDIVVPYSTEQQIKEIDTAQSADVMVFTQGETQTYILRRLGDDTTWDFIPAPIVNPPLYDPNDTGTPDTPMWSEPLGYAKYCTFHQGRLWLAGSTHFPQNLWASVIQDFFNFALGTSESTDSIQEAIDTDFINPITGIFSARQLQLFTRGDEFVNGAKVITPLLSSWTRETNYGSEYNVPPIAVDGSTIFVDSTGRTVRNFTYADERGGYDSPSISASAEHLVKVPVRMGVLRGSEVEPANFVFIVNSDGTIALLNVSKAHSLLAWTEWITQGNYRDIVTIDDEAYILVERYKTSASQYVTDNGVQVTDNGEAVWDGDIQPPNTLSLSWMLERISDIMLVDSGSINESIVEITAQTSTGGNDNFFGVYFEPDGKGKIVIVSGGIIIYQSEFLRDNPTDPYIDANDVRYSAGTIFSYNDSVREQYFDKELGYRWYMHILNAVTTADNGTNYIDGLTHLIDVEVVSVLDGNVQAPQIVVSGDAEETVGRTYPDGNSFRYDASNQLEELTLDGVRTDTITYDAVNYINPSLTEYGYLISGNVGEAGSVYIQKGVVRSAISDGFVLSGNAETVAFDVSGSPFTMTCNGGQSGLSYTWTQFPDNTQPHTRLGFNFNNGGLVDGTANGSALFSDGNTGQFYNTFLSVANNVITLRMVHTSGTPIVDSVGSLSYDVNTGKFIGGITCADPLLPSSAHGLSADVNGDLVISFPNSGGTSPSSVSLGWVIGGTGSNQRFTQKAEVRKMQLVATTVTDGIVIFPDTTYKVGQAGLFFPVVAQTMPLSASATRSGNMVNEPKRIVSITTRYKDTQGVKVNGIEIPERQFGEAVFDKSPPLLTGIEKNRHLGYNRDTTVTISQDDPMPFTLLSIDIELNQ